MMNTKPWTFPETTTAVARKPACRSHNHGFVSPVRQTWQIDCMSLKVTYLPSPGKKRRWAWHGPHYSLNVNHISAGVMAESWCSVLLPGGFKKKKLVSTPRSTQPKMVLWKNVLGNEDTQCNVDHITRLVPMGLSNMAASTICLICPRHGKGPLIYFNYLFFTLLCSISLYFCLLCYA